MTRPSRFERAVVAELGHLARTSRRRGAREDRPRVLAQRLHHGQHELLAHVRRVAYAVPAGFRPIAWLHHATTEGGATPRDLAAVRLTAVDMRAIELIAGVDPLLLEPGHVDLRRRIANASGAAGHAARVVVRAALADISRFGLGSSDRLHLPQLNDLPAELSP